MKVSVIVPTYNRARYIGRAIRSLLDQAWSRDNYEIIVVNDGSSDPTAAVLDTFGNSIRVFTLPANKGLPHACNVGIKNALGRYVVRVDDDDYVHADFLKTLCNFLEMNKELAAVASDYYLINSGEEIVERRNFETHPIACGIMFRKDSLIDIGLYDEQFLRLEDEDLRIRFLKKYSIYRIPLPLYRYMRHNLNMTGNHEESERYRLMLNEKHGL